MVEIISNISFYWLLSQVYFWEILEFRIQLMVDRLEFGGICPKVDKLLLQGVQERKSVSQGLDHRIARFTHLWNMTSEVVYFFDLFHCLEFLSFSLILNLFSFQ